MNWKRGLGIALIFIGIFIIATAKVITGAVIGFKSENLLGLLGILMLVAGIVLVFVEREEKESKLVRVLNQELKSGSVKSYPYLIRMATKIGCILKEGKKHYKVFRADRTPLIGRDGRQEEIPYHTKNTKKGTYLSILRTLYSYALELEAA